MDSEKSLIGCFIGICLVGAIGFLYSHENSRKLDLEQAKARTYRTLALANEERVAELSKRVVELEIDVKFLRLQGEMGVMCETVALYMFNALEYSLARDEKFGIKCYLNEDISLNYQELLRLYSEMSDED